MGKKDVQWVIVLVGVIMGLLLTIQFRATQQVKMNVPVQRAKEISTQLEKVRSDREGLKLKVEKLRKDLDQMAQGPQLSEQKSKLEAARIEAGVSNVAGRGVRVTLNDSNVALQPDENPNLYVLHDEDVLKVLNELKSSGAEAISINDQRLLATTEVRCVGPTILVNKTKRLAPPFTIYAIGDPVTMENALKMRGGVIESLKIWGIQVNVEKQDRVVIDAYSGTVSYKYAQSAVSLKGDGQTSE
ncbi:protein of unknown function DUF881 [Desulfofarcimen acetoxidans DSM 771]|uniref:Division initiation protein n=1 Tax=Desulfofarcimen acetoxidans (strain ATCC 49208 / DSM 771 / KCTC 5769 / VKM B-1644 / 5575) TaxID=485916 RepID=C8W478_DESAS|nr:DUF881 domain-containing protein [Desulfofarcimen acetoxidans]ACV61946.1 protein of unknown function DUF881 [Desulfofarcimen acetoxidans DSM 771]